jgi:hypothetical protein
MNFKEHKNCRVCGSDRLSPYIDLGKLPLSNNLCNTVYDNPERFPLKVLLCERCGLSQLSIVVDPEILFGHYVYRSSISAGYKVHCRFMAIELKERYKLHPMSFMIDLAGNDGTLLTEFKKEIGLRILNIDPAINLNEICQEKGIPIISEFWSENIANRVLDMYGKADLITATNVFAHVDDVSDFLRGAKVLLRQTGVLVMEFPYLIDFIENNEFDTIYFEHLSYFSISPLNDLCKRCGLTLLDVEKQNIHGGSVRVHIGYGKQKKSVIKFIENEESYKSIDPYVNFSDVAYRTINDFRSKIAELNNGKHRVAAFAASAKGNTLLNCASITNVSIEYIVDETPEKRYKFSPGTHIPIYPIEALHRNPPDYLVILSWNFAKEIMMKCRAAGYNGKFVLPIPYWQIID